MTKLLIQDLGFKVYQEVWDLQQDLFQSAQTAKKNKVLPDNYLLLVEHAPVFTLGKSASEANLLGTEEFLGAQVFKIERGGDVTFHGPGQLVLYPIIDLEQFNMSLREYIFNLEEVIIQTLQTFNIKASRLEGASGVWLDVGSPKERKIAALGVKASRHITMHGLAFNINTDLSWFQKINPCGFVDKGVTSLATELQENQDFEVVKSLVINNFQSIFLNQN